MILNIILIPIYALLAAVHIALSLILKLSDWVFYLFGGLFVLVTILCYFMQLEDQSELRRMLIASSSLFIIPLAANLFDGMLQVMIETIGSKIGNQS